MSNLPPLPLSQMPGAYPKPPRNTPEFTAYALEVCDQEAVLDLLRHLNPRRLAQSHASNNTPAAVAVPTGAASGR